MQFNFIVELLLASNCSELFINLALFLTKQISRSQNIKIIVIIIIIVIVENIENFCTLFQTF